MQLILKIFIGYLQPQLLVDRLVKCDVDGMMDRHIVCVVKRRTMLYEDIGPEVGYLCDCFIIYIAVI